MGASPKQKLYFLAEKYGLSTHASSIGSIAGRIEHIRDELSEEDEKMFKSVANELGFSELIE